MLSIYLLMEPIFNERIQSLLDGIAGFLNLVFKTPNTPADKCDINAIDWSNLGIYKW
ncbi:hypothetical protein FHS59_000179 [Algoriphagus iocasae]|uniref:Uncharacterized protein n=1 Tax=Algoriphagus iocasae TaxID=1836499 RepID=A0A841MI60_9BACT|nr:hypothetical protein [Algoriphagus iocasae]